MPAWLPPQHAHSALRRFGSRPQLKRLSFPPGTHLQLAAPGHDRVAQLNGDRIIYQRVTRRFSLLDPTLME